MRVGRFAVGYSEKGKYHLQKVRRPIEMLKQARQDFQVPYPFSRAIIPLFETMYWYLALRVT